MTVELKGYIEGPRWAAIESRLRKAAVDYGIDIITDKKTGLIRETVFFTATGKKDRIELFRDAVLKATSKLL